MATKSLPIPEQSAFFQPRNGLWQHDFPVPTTAHRSQKALWAEAKGLRVPNSDEDSLVSTPPSQKFAWARAKGLPIPVHRDDEDEEDDDEEHEFTTAAELFAALSAVSPIPGRPSSDLDDSVVADMQNMTIVYPDGEPMDMSDDDSGHMNVSEEEGDSSE